jgi:hypothetical protein
MGLFEHRKQIENYRLLENFCCGANTTTATTGLNGPVSNGTFPAPGGDPTLGGQGFKGKVKKKKRKINEEILENWLLMESPARLAVWAANCIADVLKHGEQQFHFNWPGHSRMESVILAYDQNRLIIQDQNTKKFLVSEKDPLTMKPQEIGIWLKEAFNKLFTVNEAAIKVTKKERDEIVKQSENGKRWKTKVQAPKKGTYNRQEAKKVNETIFAEPVIRDNKKDVKYTTDRGDEWRIEFDQYGKPKEKKMTNIELLRRKNSQGLRAQPKRDAQMKTSNGKQSISKDKRDSIIDSVGSIDHIGD